MFKAPSSNSSTASLQTSSQEIYHSQIVNESENFRSPELIDQLLQSGWDPSTGFVKDVHLLCLQWTRLFPIIPQISYAHVLETTELLASSPLRDHQCHNRCRFLRDRAIYICKKSGNLHYCNSTSCQYKIKEQDTYICSITGTTYPLDLHDEASTNFFHENMNYDDSSIKKADKEATLLDLLTEQVGPPIRSVSAPATASIRRKRKQPSLSSPALSTVLEVPRSLSLSPPVSVALEQPLSKLSLTDYVIDKDSYDYLTLSSEVYSLLLKIFPKQDDFVQSLPMKKITSTVVSHWLKIEQLKRRLNLTEKYLFPFHTVVLLRDMKKGLKIEQTIEILPQILDLAVLPEIKDPLWKKVMSRFQMSVITNTTSLWRKYCNLLYIQNQ